MSKFVLNMQAVNEEAEKMNSSGSGKGYFSRKQIQNGKEVDIRILPPLPSLNGLFYMKRIQIWINKKPYLSPKTFGKPCIIHDMLDEINKGNDENLKKLANSQSFSIAEDYLMPILLIKPIYKNNSLESVEVIDDCVKIFDATWGIVKKLNNLVTHRQYQNGSPLGIFDPGKGYNIILSKEEKNNKTEYDCMGYTQSTVVDEKYLDNIPDIYEEQLKRLPSDDVLENVARSYFYGEELKEVPKTEPNFTIEPAPKSGSSILDRLKANQARK